MENKEIVIDENLSFEAAMARLEEIAQKLESGRAPLDESMKYYEEGIRLINFCRRRIGEARQKVVELGADGGQSGAN